MNAEIGLMNAEIGTGFWFLFLFYFMGKSVESAVSYSLVLFLQ
jgi:hypothetical protein